MKTECFLVSSASRSPLDYTCIHVMQKALGEKVLSFQRDIEVRSILVFFHPGNMYTDH